MGADIHIIGQKKSGERWINTEPVIDSHRHYGLFGWLADVRNYSEVGPLVECRGLPPDFQDYDWSEDLHSLTWYSLDELLAVDYDQIVEDRRVTRGNDGGCTCAPGEGEKIPLREFLPDYWLPSISLAKSRGVERFIFGFDN